VAFLCGIVGIGIGAVRSINYIEENPYAAKEKIQMIVYGIIASHMFFMIIRLPLYVIIFSLTIQYAFNALFDSYPFIKPEDPKFLYGVLASLVNHFLLIKFFVGHSYGIIVVILSFIIIWATPFCFFFSMSAADDAPFANHSGKSTKTYVGMAFDWLMTIGKKSMKGE